MWRVHITRCHSHRRPFLLTKMWRGQWNRKNMQHALRSRFLFFAKSPSPTGLTLNIKHIQKKRKKKKETWMNAIIYPVLTLGSWQLLAAVSFKAAGGTLLRLLGRCRALRLAIEGVVTLSRRLLPIRTWEVELAVLLPWLPIGLWTVWAELVLELLVEDRKVGGAAVNVGWLVRTEAEDGAEMLNPL